MSVSSPPAGFMGAGKIEAVKAPVLEPGTLPACPDTSEHTEKYITVKSTGLLVGHTGHEDGGPSMDVTWKMFNRASSSDETEKVYFDTPNTSP